MRRRMGARTLALVALLGLAACGPSVSSSDPPSPPPPTSAPQCNSLIMSVDEVEAVLADARRSLEEPIVVQAAALTQAMHARIGLARTIRFIKSDRAIEWQLRMIHNRFAPQYAELCQDQ